MIGVVCFVIGVPTYFFACVYGRKHKLYRIPYFWGGVADLGKRLFIILAATFVSDHV